MDIVVPYVRRRAWLPHDVLVAELHGQVKLAATAPAGASTHRFRVVEFADLDDAARADARVAIVDGPSQDQLAALPALEWVQSTWAGVEAVLPAVPEHVAVARMIDPQLTHTMAEAVLAWTLYLHRDMPRYAAQQRARDWIEQPLVRTSDRRVGVLGLGVLGRAAAARLVANGFPVLGWARTPKPVEGIETFVGDDGLERLLERSDIVVNLLPDTLDTRRLLDRRAFDLLPTGAALINFGRGPTVDDDALLDALDDGRVEHAVLDVFTTEPLPDDHPYWDHPHVTVLPHVSGPTSPDTAASIVVANLRRWLDTGELPADALVDRGLGY